MRGGRHRPIAGVGLRAFGAQLLQHVQRGGGVRAMHLAVAAEALADGLADLRIVHRVRLELGAQRGVVALVEPAQALDIARRADVHRIGQGRHAGLRRVIGAGEEVRQHAVGVGRQHDPAQRHAQRPRQDRGQRIAQVAGGHHQIQRLRMRGMVLQGCMRVVAHLRQQAPQADAVGRTQRRLRLQVGVVQCLLDQRLAIVERAGHAQRLDVVAKAPELMRLPWRHAPVRIQHHHAQPGLAMERGRDRGTGIAGGGDEDGQRRFRTPPQPGQTGGQEARAEVLERGGRPMEQLQRVVAGRGQRLQRRGEVEGLRADGRQFRSQSVAIEERRQQIRGGLGEAGTGAQVAGGGQALGDVQAAIGGESGGDGLAERDRRCGVTGGDEVHGGSGGRGIRSHWHFWLWLWLLR
ncbi:hypothetical protein NB717_001950 [Xanthomonas sacchari]|nr:hypothetical protein [Xanthomonas sacchari]